MTAPSPPSADQLRLDLHRHLPRAAADFLRSGCNAEAVAALERWPDGSGGVLSLTGPAGSGKSHLAAVWSERLGAAPLHGAEAALADPVELEGRPVLLDRAEDVDDETLFHLMNLAQAPGGALLMVSRSPPASWSAALPDLRSRLDAVRTVSLQEPDDAVLAIILTRAFEARSIRPPDDLIAFLVRRIDRSAAAAEAVVDRLDALHRPVTRALAASLFSAGESADLFG